MDVLDSGPGRPRRGPSRRLVVGGAAVVSALSIAAAVWSGGGSGEARPTATPAAPVRGGPDAGVGAGEVPGLLINGTAPGSTLDRRDSGSSAGPWTVVVRRHDGSLARHGAVVTFPVPASVLARGIDVGGVRGAAADGQIVWPVAGGFAQVRGDLSEPELLGIARATRIVSGRPAVTPPPGFTRVAAGPFHPPVVREARYGSAELGEGRVLGSGLTFTGTTGTAGLEDELYATAATPSGTVKGHPAVTTTGLTGNAVLAWEAAPGITVYVGYSGSSYSAAATAALHRLAVRSRLVTAAAWHATTPQPA